MSIDTKKIKSMSLATVKSMSNELMVKNATRLVEIYEGLKKGTWEFAEITVETVEKETFKDDFGTLENFAKWLDVNKSALTNWKKAVTFAKEHKCNKSAYSVSQCIDFASIENICKEKSLDFKEFTKWICAKNKVRYPYDISVKAIRTGGKEWLAVKLATDTVETVETDETAETTETAETIEKNVEMVTFTIGDNTYTMPADLLAQYMVK